MSDGKTAVLTRKSPLEKFASFCGSAAAWLAALVLFGLAAASLIARMDLLDVSTLAGICAGVVVGVLPADLPGE